MYTSIVGLQWGDEGKGKVVDFFAGNFYAVARFQGGANAGHTVFLKEEPHIFHLIPTGLLHKEVKGVIGAGVVLDPEVLLKEIAWITKRSGPLEGRLFVDGRAHVVLPHHKEEDYWEEETKGGIGTTKKGIGPSYRDLYARYGVRLIELMGEERNRALERAITFNNQILGGRYGKPPISKETVWKRIREFLDTIAPFVSNVPYILENWEKEGREILLEGAQGALLDIFFGTYPFVTSSHTIAGGASAGLGVSPGKIKRVIGVMKAYTTRVGGGPFPTELKGDQGKTLRERGNEFGATTGRPRRCGWLDLVSARYASLLNGVTDIVMTKLDVLRGFDSVKVGVSYKKDGEVVDRFPMSISELEEVEPEYTSFEGWEDEDIEGEIRGSAAKYVKSIEDYLGIPVSFISTGKERESMIPRPETGWV